MSLKDVINEVLTQASSDVKRDFFNNEMQVPLSKWASDEEKDFVAKLEELGIKFNSVDDYGGEGMGEEYWSVYSFNDDNEIVYVKFDGYYASYNGADFEEFFFVEPEQVTVTQFNRV